MSKDKNNTNDEEVQKMNKTTQEYKRLDFSKLNFNNTPLSTEESLRDISPINWTKEILSGKKKVTLHKKKEN